MNILIIDRFPDIFLQELSSLAVQVTYLPEIDRKTVLSLIEDQHILILNSKVKVDRALVDRANHLMLVVRAGVGMDHIDEEYLAEKGIRAVNTAGQNADAVGEQAIGMLLAMRNNLIRADKQVRTFQWIREANRGVELGGKTVGIIGFGNTGKAVAKRLTGFGCNILAYDKYVNGFGSEQVKEVEMEDIYRTADVCSFHIPLTAETRHLANDTFFRSVSKTHIFPQFG